MRTSQQRIVIPPPALPKPSSKWTAIAAVLVALLLVTAFDLARAAERTLAESPPEEPLT